MKDIQFAYLAGIVDGEGTIGIYKVTDDRRKTNGIYYRTNFKIANSCKSLILDLQKLFGGTVVEYQPRYSQSKKSYVWSCNKVALQLEILKGIIPYLRVKKNQAEVVVEFLLNMEQTRWAGRNNNRTLKALGKYDYLESLYTKTRELNRRGHSEKIVGEFGEYPNVESRTIPSQADEGNGSSEGVETTKVSPNNNPSQETPPRKGRYSPLLQETVRSAV